MSLEAKVRIKDPSYGKDGRLHVHTEWLEKWNSVPYLEEDQCSHEETMCIDCRASWESDYEVILDLTT